MSDENIIKLRKIVHRLEDPMYPSLGPLLSLMGLTGLWHPIRSIGSTIKKTLFYITVCFFFSQYVRSIMKFDYASLKLLLQYSPFHLGIIKGCHFHIKYKLWEDFINYTGDLEQKQLSVKERDMNKLVNNYINRNRYVTYFYWSMSFCSCISVFSEFYQNDFNNIYSANFTQSVLFDIYAPFSEHPIGYYAYIALQTVIGSIASGYVVGWDTFVVAVMIFFTGQLRIAKHYCTKLIDSKNNEVSRKNIVEFHQYYITLIKYQKLFSTLISPIMFAYLFIVSVNLGLTIIDILLVKDDVIRSINYMSACFVQLLFYYWHSNEVVVESLNVSYGIFESDWTAADHKVQKDVALLSILTTKRFIFKAGPYNQMTLNTFIAIIRGSYSFYTLLSETM